MRNELQAAVRYFEMRCEGKTDFEALAMCDRREMERTALSALRDALQRQPDPITGLVPCGCGGKAKVWPSEPTQFTHVITDYEVGCTECAMTTGWVRGKQENATKVWNRAMGHRGEAPHEMP